MSRRHRTPPRAPEGARPVRQTPASSRPATRQPHPREHLRPGLLRGLPQRSVESGPVQVPAVAVGVEQEVVAVRRLGAPGGDVAVAWQVAVGLDAAPARRGRAAAGERPAGGPRRSGPCPRPIRPPAGPVGPPAPGSGPRPSRPGRRRRSRRGNPRFISGGAPARGPGLAAPPCPTRPRARHAGAAPPPAPRRPPAAGGAAATAAASRGGSGTTIEGPNEATIIEGGKSGSSGTPGRTSTSPMSPKMRTISSICPAVLPFRGAVQVIRLVNARRRRSRGFDASTTMS